MGFVMECTMQRDNYFCCLMTSESRLSCIYTHQILVEYVSYGIYACTIRTVIYICVLHAQMTDD